MRGNAVFVAPLCALALAACVGGSDSAPTATPPATTGTASPIKHVIIIVVTVEGPRIPLLAVSPFSRGGDLFDLFQFP